MCSIQLSEGFAIYVVMWQQRMFCKILYTSPKKCWTGKIVPFLPCLHKTELKSSPHFHSIHLKQQSRPLQHQPGVFTLSKQVLEYILGAPAFHNWILVCHLFPSLPALSVLIWTVNMDSSVLVYMYLLLFCWMIHEVIFFLWLLLFS